VAKSVARLDTWRMSRAGDDPHRTADHEHASELSETQLSGPARKFVRGPERTSGLRSCQVRVVFVPPAAAPSQLPVWDGGGPRQQATPLLG
jgi:hypothetical protein